LSVEVIRDPRDPRLDDVRDLRRGPERRRESALGWFVVEGTLALERVAAAGHRLRSIVTTEARRAAVDALDLPGDAPRLLVEPGCLDEVTGFRAHRGVLASAERPPTAELSDVLDRRSRIVFVEAITDVENLGAIFRIAAGFGFDAVVLDPRCADPLYRRCVRVSLGWSAALAWARAPSSAAALEAFHARDLSTVALTPAPSARAVDAALETGVLCDPLVLMVGAEGTGLEPATIERATHAVRIPMAGDVDSLNVATALGVVAAFAASGRDWRP
jgi:tRNA G18 (ribose-2'-O)-methylase SpoU